jgi:propanediol dehydratase small subunit
MPAATLSSDMNERAKTKAAAQPRTPMSAIHPAPSATQQPGMTATIEAKTGHNTVLKYLLKPVIKTLNESMGER